MARAEINVKVSDLDAVKELIAALTARAERAEAAIQRVRALAAGWASDPGWGEIFFNDAAEAILAALDGTHPDAPAPGRSGEEKP